MSWDEEHNVLSLLMLSISEHSFIVFLCLLFFLWFYTESFYVYIPGITSESQELHRVSMDLRSWITHMVSLACPCSDLMYWSISQGDHTVPLGLIFGSIKMCGSWDAVNGGYATVACTATIRTDLISHTTTSLNIILGRGSGTRDSLFSQ